MLTIALTALCTGRFAQEPANGTAGTLSWSLAEAQEYAVANNKSLQNASQKNKKAYAQLLLYIHSIHFVFLAMQHMERRFLPIILLKTNNGFASTFVGHEKLSLKSTGTNFTCI